jgi:hypothetical protein
VNVASFDDSVEFEEVKARAAKESKLGMVFTPSKKERLTQQDSRLDSPLVFEIDPNVRANISALPIIIAG